MEKIGERVNKSSENDDERGNDTITFQLPKPLNVCLEQAIERGDYSTKSELIRWAIRNEIKRLKKEYQLKRKQEEKQANEKQNEDGK